MWGFHFNFFIKGIKTYESENYQLYKKLVLCNIRLYLCCLRIVVDVICASQLSVIDKVNCFARSDRYDIFYKMKDAIIWLFFSDNVIEFLCKVNKIATENGITAPIPFIAGITPIHQKWYVAGRDETINELLFTLPMDDHFTFMVIIGSAQYDAQFSANNIMNIVRQTSRHC